MSGNWDDEAGAWDTNDDVIYYSEKAYEALLDTGNIEGRRILDFGCGTGLLTERLSPIVNSVVAIDASPKMIDVLKSKNLHNVTAIPALLTQELIDDDSLFDEKFDLVVASSVLSFIPDYQSTLKLLRSILSRDGLIVQWDWLQTDDPDFGLSEATVLHSLEVAGFSDIEISKPFDIAFEKGSMSVIMAVARNA